MATLTDVVAWINHYPSGGGAEGMARIILSLYNGARFPVDLGGMICRLDRANRQIALSIIADYIQNGESAELRDAGEKLASLYVDASVTNGGSQKRGAI